MPRKKKDQYETDLPSQLQKMEEEADAQLEQAMKARGEAPEEAANDEVVDPGEDATASDDDGVEPPAEPTPPKEDPPAEPKSPQVDEELLKELRIARAEKQQLRVQLEEMKHLVEKISQKEPEPAVPQERIQVDPAKFEDVGEDFVTLANMVNKISSAHESLQGEFRKLREELTGVSKVQTMTAKERLYATLAEKVPNWETINQDPAWLQWLGERDPISGIVRQELLDGAAAQFDAHRVVELFKAFATQSGIPLGGQHAVSTPAAPTNTPQRKASVEPSKQGARSTPTGDGKPVFTKAQVDAIYKDYINGLYMDRESEFRKIERQIFEAAKEGRIVPK